MANLNGFNANNVDPNTPLEAIPEGKYIAQIVESGWKPNKAGTGRYLELKFEVVEGEYKGRNLWDRLNLEHPNSTAVQIAQGDLSAICRAVNVMQPKDSVEMHNIPLALTVKVKKREDNGELANEIKGYESRGAAKQGAGQGSAQTEKVEARPAASDDVAPWLR
jgi:hypothetical protein